MAIFKRDGRFRIQVSYPNGKGGYNRISKTAKTKSEAIQIQSAILKQVKETTDNTTITFGVLAEQFLNDAKTKDRISTILMDYEKKLRVNLIPYFGSYPMDEIKADTINKWKNTMTNAVSPRTGKKYSWNYLLGFWKVLSLVFSFGKKQYGIPDTELVRAGGFRKDPNAIIQQKELNYWTPDQFTAWYNAIDADAAVASHKDRSWMILASVKVLVSICFFAGLRKGEANSLLVEDFHDGRNPYLSIYKSVCQKLKANPYLISNPKTKSSIRDVPIPKQLADILRDHIATHLSRLKYFRGAFFLCGGIVPIADTTIEKYKEKYEKIANVPHIRVHDLRHSFVSMLINQGVNVQTITSLVGHSSPAITWSVYSHLYPKSKNKAVSMIDGLTPDLGKK